MDELEKRAEQGLDSFKKHGGDLGSTKSSLDGMVDDVLGDDEEIVSQPKKSNLQKWILAVIAVLGLSYIGYQGFKDGKSSEKVSLELIYAQNFEVIGNAAASSERGEQGNEEMSVGEKGLKYYNASYFKEAAPLLVNQEEAKYLVFGAIAEMKNSNIESAVALFDKARSASDGIAYTDIINWYQALAYIKTNQKANAKVLLTELASKNQFKSFESTTILEQIK